MKALFVYGALADPVVVFRQFANTFDMVWEVMNPQTSKILINLRSFGIKM